MSDSFKMIKTRHLGNGQISQTYDGRVIFRGLPRDFPASPDSLTGKALEAHLQRKKARP